MLANVQNNIPQGTKDYIADAKNKIFNRQHLRSPTVFFGMGEEKPFYLERVPSLVTERLRHNLSFFYLNYILITAVLFCLTMITSPSAIIGIGLLAFAWMAVIRATSEGSVQVKGVYFILFPWFVVRGPSIMSASVLTMILLSSIIQELLLLKSKHQWEWGHSPPWR